MEGAFRKIDIDAFDEEVIQESELYEVDPRDPSVALDEARQKSASVRSLLSKYSVHARCSAVLTDLGATSRAH